MTKRELGEIAGFVSLLASVLLITARVVIAGETDIHDNPYVQAAALEGIPRELLVAIAGAESGFHPWALNIDGRQVYCHSREEAEQLLSGIDEVDIGLMQINWPFWGPRFGLSKSQLLDPRTNLVYGARILKQDLARTGNIWLRISDYHAGSLKRRDRYNKLVYEQYLRYLQGKVGPLTTFQVIPILPTSYPKSPSYVREIKITSQLHILPPTEEIVLPQGDIEHVGEREERLSARLRPAAFRKTDIGRLPYQRRILLPERSEGDQEWDRRPCLSMLRERLRLRHLLVLSGSTERCGPLRFCKALHCSYLVH